MNLSDLYEHLKQRMDETRKEYSEISEMIKNAQEEGINPVEWPQYSRYLGLKAEWAAYREIKELVADILASEQGTS